MNISEVITSVSTVIDKVKSILPKDQSSLFNQLSTIQAELEQNKADQASSDTFRNRPHAAIVWVLVLALLWNTIINGLFYNIAQVLGHTILVYTIDWTALITLISIMVCGKALGAGYELFDTIHKRISDSKVNTDDSSNSSNT